MRLVLLGHPQPLDACRWKDDLAEGAAALGWRVTHVDADRAPVDDVVGLCRDADLFIWARTHNRQPSGDAWAMLRRIEDFGVPTVGVHMDLYWGLTRRQRYIGRHPWWSCQWVFTADGGLRDWAGRGVNHRWLPPAAGPRFLGVGVPDRGRFPHPVVFVGGWVPRIHGRHRGDLLAWAYATFGRDFGRYGPPRPVWGEEFTTLCASTVVVLGDSAPAAGYWSDRIPLTLSRGGVLAHPDTPGMAGWGFTDETMILYRRGQWHELGARIGALTAGQRRTLSANAVQVVRDRHLWQHRLAYVAEVVLDGAGDRGVRRVAAQVGSSAAAASVAGAG